MKHPVLLTEAAERDLEEIHGYIATHDSPEAAERVLRGIENAAAKLSSFPERGPIPSELAAFGMKEFRQTFFKPYRRIYRIMDSVVYIYVIADGRRNMQTLLERRILLG